MYIPWNEGLPPTLLWARPRPSVPKPLRGRHVFAYARARGALSAAIPGLGLRPGDRILAPAYVCGSALAPFHEADIEVVLYPVCPASLHPDWAAARVLAARTGARALLLVHYFGLPCAPDEARAFCDQHHLLLIEDCAHSFLSTWCGRPLGALGNAAVFSLRKLIPVPDGGVLHLRDAPHAPCACPAPRRESPLVLAPALARYAAQRIGCAPGSRTWCRRTDDASTPESSGRCPADQGISTWSLRILWRMDLARVAQRRQENYRQLAGALSEHPPVRLLRPDLPEGACPQVLPAIVPHAPEVAAAMKRLGVHAYTWPALPKAAERASPTAGWLARHMLALPVHQGMSPDHVEYAAACFRRVCPPSGERLSLPAA